MNAALADIVPWLVWSVVLVAATAIDAVYCGMESGIYVLNKIRLDLRVEAGSRAARTLQGLLGDANNLLAVLLIGTNAARFVATFCVGAMFVQAGCGDRSKWYTLAVATPLLFVFSDAVPKGVFQRLSERLTYRLAWFLRASDLVFRYTGMSLLVRGFSSAMLRLANPGKRRRQAFHRPPLAAIVAEGRASGVLTHFQSTMANRVLNISDVTLRDVMIPMRRVVSAPQEVDRERICELIRREDYSRIPLVGADGQVEAVLDVHAILTAGENVVPFEAARKPMILAAQTTVTDALFRMRRARRALTVVADAGGKHMGIATIKDLVEEIVGELETW